MPALNEAVSAQSAVLAELLTCTSTADPELLNTLEQQTAALQELLSNLRSAEQTPQNKDPQSIQPMPEMRAKNPEPTENSRSPPRSTTLRSSMTTTMSRRR